MLSQILFFLGLQIAELYKKDPFNLELALEYWCPSEPLQSSAIMGSYIGITHQRPPQRQVRKDWGFFLYYLGGENGLQRHLVFSEWKCSLHAHEW